MIYLIDDKKRRQSNDFNWHAEKFDQFDDVIQPVYTLEEIEAISAEVFVKGNCVLYHESFLDNTRKASEAAQKRRKLELFSNENPEFLFATFSGSKKERIIHGNSAALPVAELYKNLAIFAEKYRNGDQNLEFLLFGENPSIERELQVLRTSSIKSELSFPAADLNGLSSVLFLDRGNFRESIEGSKEIQLLNDTSDEKLSYILDEHLTMETDLVFLPLCFGASLSDYNGLRLATHIRCTPGPNQLKPIFIYGYVGIDSLWNHEYFGILRTKNVFLIPQSKKAFKEAGEMPQSSFDQTELPQELNKLKLSPPLDYEDEHSIINEWAIYQWANALEIEHNDELERTFNNVGTNIYFKYFKTKYFTQLSKTISRNDLLIEKVGEPRVLLVDDEINKGWFEIFSFLLYEKNGISIDCIGDEFRYTTREQVISNTISFVEDNDIDVIILDYRLHPEDFETQNHLECSGMKLLKSVKQLNPGIQVIIFSATRDAMILHDLNHEADAFIHKALTTSNKDQIEKAISAISESISRSNWLKSVWDKTRNGVSHLDARRKMKKLDPNFTQAVITFLYLGFESLSSRCLKRNMDSAFVYYFLILEACSAQIIDEDNPIKVQYTSKYGEQKIGYSFEFRSSYDQLKDFEGNDYKLISKGDTFISDNKRIPYPVKFHNVIDYSGATGIDPVSIVKLRNAFSHPNLTETQKIVTISRDNCLDIFEICYSLLMKM